MARECEKHTSLEVDTVETGQDHVNAFVVCKDCDGAWDLSGYLNPEDASMSLSAFSKLHEGFEPTEYD
jgi:hypothetical protein